MNASSGHEFPENATFQLQTLHKLKLEACKAVAHITNFQINNYICNITAHPLPVNRSDTISKWNWGQKRSGFGTPIHKAHHSKLILQIHKSSNGNSKSHLYSNISHKVATSLYFGVSPTLMTLSERAMHSMQSPDI